MTLCVSPKDVALFRRRALKRYPVEYIEMLWGVTTRDSLTVLRFVKPAKQKGTRTLVNYEYEERPPEPGLTLIGTIHSHPDNEAYPSEYDNVGCRECGDLLMGIMSIKKSSKRRKTVTKWWLPQHPLEPVDLTTAVNRHEKP